jgi:prepilin-type N-terminal cleavage/methylation domain-containing protein
MTKSTNRGFSLVEVLVAVGVLAVGLVGLANYQVYSIKGAARAEQTNASRTIAAQVAHRLATQNAGLPACTTDEGCRANNGEYTNEKAGDCTQYARDFVPDLQGDFPQVGGSMQPGSYRVDLGVLPHIDATEHADDQVLRVWVCWLDSSGQVQEYQISRLLPGEGI